MTGDELFLLVLAWASLLLAAASTGAAWLAIRGWHRAMRQLRLAEAQAAEAVSIATVLVGDAEEAV